MFNNINDRLEAILDVKSGTFHNFFYTSDVPVKSAFKDKVSIKKYSSINGRTGVSYIKVIPVSSDSCVKKSNSVSVIKNKVKYNENTKNYLLSIYPRTNSKVKSNYIVTTSDGSYCVNDLSSFKEMIPNSYFSRNATKYMTINLNNLVSIN